MQRYRKLISMVLAAGIVLFSAAKAYSVVTLVFDNARQEPLILALLAIVAVIALWLIDRLVERFLAFLGDHPRPARRPNDGDAGKRGTADRNEVSEDESQHPKSRFPPAA